MDCNSREDLKFFGKVSASVSHEIKNVFAVINEGAGLLGDLALMAEKGMPLDPERLARVSQSIQGQIKRGDAIIKNMNAFAHSVDEQSKEVDLFQVLELVAALASRKVQAAAASISVAQFPEAKLITDPYSLEQLLFGMVETLLGFAREGTIYEFSAQVKDKKIVILLTGVDPHSEIIVGPCLVELAARLGAELTAPHGSGSLQLSMAP